MLRRCFVTIFVLMLTLATAQGVQEQPLSDFWLNDENSDFSNAGLEASNAKNVAVVIEELEQGTYDFGITTVQIRGWVQTRFSQVGLAYREYTDVAGAADLTYLYMSLDVVGPAFSVELNFDRQAYFDANGITYQTIATTWSKRLVGAHNYNVLFVQNSLEQLLDMFFNDYLMSTAVTLP